MMNMLGVIYPYLETERSVRTEYRYYVRRETLMARLLARVIGLSKTLGKRGVSAEPAPSKVAYLSETRKG
jgi:hypothetical protein